MMKGSMYASHVWEATEKQRTNETNKDHETESMVFLDLTAFCTGDLLP